LAELTGYLAPDGFLPELQQELGSAVIECHGRLVLARGPARPVAWVANVWHEPVHIPIQWWPQAVDATLYLKRIRWSVW
jgi:23S rRNA (cytidine2498-2'-O)-methyltransferase